MINANGKKYNSWCERKPLMGFEQERILRAYSHISRKDISNNEKAAFFLHELTDCDGLEFVAFTNVRINKQVVLSDAVMLTPCFLSQTGVYDMQDPLAQKTLSMEKNGRFVYDGWIQICNWTVSDVKNAIKKINEVLTFFSFRIGSFVDWEPKYDVKGNGSPVYEFENEHLKEIGDIVRNLELSNDADRTSVYRSLGWFSQAFRLKEPPARFLFLILAIESLATYVEESENSSSFFHLKINRKDREQRRKERDECIKKTLSEFSSDLTKAIRESYSQCVQGSQKILKAHFESLYGTDSEPFRLLFEDIGGGSSLYDLRNKIAHGRYDSLNESEKIIIQERIWDAERISRNYILKILESGLGINPFNSKMTAKIHMNMMNMIGTGGVVYRGPTHMALIYS